MKPKQRSDPSDSQIAQDWIAHSRPSTGREEIEALEQVLQSGYLARGPWTRQFEESIGGYLGKPHARAVASGTIALQLALLSLAPDEAMTDLETLHDWFRGKTVLIPAYTCAAVLYAVQWVGAQPVLLDVDPETCCLDPAHAVEAADETTLAAIVVNLFGHPGSSLPLNVDFVWIEDIAQALGARRNNRPVGSDGLLTVCSFYATKVLCTGTGGMTLTSDTTIGTRLDNILHYDNHTDPLLHCSWAMGDLQGAIGLKQWEKLTKMIQRRSEIAEIYTDALVSHPGVAALPVSNHGEGGLIPGHLYYRYTVRLSGHAGPLIDRMQENGIEAKRPVHVPLYRLTGEPPTRFPVTEEIDRTTISLPIYPLLDDKQARQVADTLLQALDNLENDAEFRAN